MAALSSDNVLGNYILSFDVVNGAICMIFAFNVSLTLIKLVLERNGNLLTNYTVHVEMLRGFYLEMDFLLHKLNIIYISMWLLSILYKASALYLRICTWKKEHHPSIACGAVKQKFQAMHHVLKQNSNQLQFKQYYYLSCLCRHCRRSCNYLHTYILSIILCIF